MGQNVTMARGVMMGSKKFNELMSIIKELKGKDKKENFFSQSLVGENIIMVGALTRKMCGLLGLRLCQDILGKAVEENKKE